MKYRFGYYVITSLIVGHLIDLCSSRLVMSINFSSVLTWLVNNQGLQSFSVLIDLQIIIELHNFTCIAWAMCQLCVIAGLYSESLAHITCLTLVLLYYSTNWVAICNLWIGGEHFICTFHPDKYLCWCFWCSFWLIRRNAFWTHN